MTKIEIEDEKYVGIKIEHIYRPTCRDNKIQKQKQMQNARQDFGIMLKDCWQASINVMVVRDL